MLVSFDMKDNKDKIKGRPGAGCVRAKHLPEGLEYGGIQSEGGKALRPSHSLLLCGRGTVPRSFYPEGCGSSATPQIASQL